MNVFLVSTKYLISQFTCTFNHMVQTRSPLLGQPRRWRIAPPDANPARAQPHLDSPNNLQPHTPRHQIFHLRQ